MIKTSAASFESIPLKITSHVPSSASANICPERNLRVAEYRDVDRILKKSPGNFRRIRNRQRRLAYELFGVYLHVIKTKLQIFVGLKTRRFCTIRRDTTWVCFQFMRPLQGCSNWMLMQYGGLICVQEMNFTFPAYLLRSEITRIAAAIIGMWFIPQSWIDSYDHPNRISVCPLTLSKFACCIKRSPLRLIGLLGAKWHT